MQPFNRGQLDGGAQHSAVNAELGALPGDRQHLGCLAQGQQPHPIPQPPGAGDGWEVGGGEGLDVEGHRRLLEARIGRLQRLELTEMGGGDREAGLLGHMAQQRRRQGRPLGGIGAGAHLVEQHQRGADLACRAPRTRRILAG